MQVFESPSIIPVQMDRQLNSSKVHIGLRQIIYYYYYYYYYYYTPLCFSGHVTYIERTLRISHLSHF
jgi:hypothetical protein